MWLPRRFLPLASCLAHSGGVAHRFMHNVYTAQGWGSLIPFPIVERDVDYHNEVGFLFPSNCLGPFRLGLDCITHEYLRPKRGSHGRRLNDNSGQDGPNCSPFLVSSRKRHPRTRTAEREVFR